MGEPRVFTVHGRHLELYPPPLTSARRRLAPGDHAALTELLGLPATASFATCFAELQSRYVEPYTGLYRMDIPEPSDGSMVPASNSIVRALASAEACPASQSPYDTVVIPGGAVSAVVSAIKFFLNQMSLGLTAPRQVIVLGCGRRLQPQELWRLRQTFGPVLSEMSPRSELDMLQFVWQRAPELLKAGSLRERAEQMVSDARPVFVSIRAESKEHHVSTVDTLRSCFAQTSANQFHRNSILLLSSQPFVRYHTLVFVNECVENEMIPAKVHGIGPAAPGDSLRVNLMWNNLGKQLYEEERFWSKGEGSSAGSR